MNFFKNLASKVQVSNVKPMPEEDVELLAIMCRHCAVDVYTGGLFGQTYAYYIPSSEDEFDIARDIFAKSGIKMQNHFSKIIDNIGTEAMRVNYTMCVNVPELRNNMKRINKKWVNLYNQKNIERRKQLREQIEQLKARQK